MKNTIKAAICAIGLIAALGLFNTANAATLDLTSANYIGSIVDGIPSSDSNELGWVNQLITLSPGATDVPSTNPAGETLNRSANIIAGLIQATSLDRDEAAPVDAWTLVAGNLYVLGKYGKGQDVQISHVWYVGNLTGQITLDSLNDSLSHSSMLSIRQTVPDGGATLILLGSALSALALIRRKMI